MGEQALPDRDGVRLRWDHSQAPVRLAWGSPPERLTEAAGARARRAPPSRFSNDVWVNVSGLALFARQDASTHCGLLFRGGTSLAKFYVFVPSSDWNLTGWVTDELTAAYGPPSQELVRAPGTHGRSSWWDVDGLRVVHALFDVVRGPAEAAEERVEIEPA